MKIAHVMKLVFNLKSATRKVQSRSTYVHMYICIHMYVCIFDVLSYLQILHTHKYECMYVCKYV